MNVARLSSSLKGRKSSSSLLGRTQSSSSARSLSSWKVDSATGIVSSTKSKDDRQFQTVIGLEIHAQLKISTKLFSGCPVPQASSLYQKPNTSVWPFDLAVPGFLPRVSQEAVQAAVLSAAATKCQIPPVSRFERKHYFYADLPLGYQVTQQRWPLAKEGVLICHRQQGKKKKTKKKSQSNDESNDSFPVRIERIQLEQDTGKTVTTNLNNVTQSLVDFNRAGCALIEIVFYPDLRSASDAAIAVETLRNLLRHIGTCDGKMEEGSLRCDLNVSVAPINDKANETDALEDILSLTGSRVEVKNLNSIRQVQQAAEYEAIRQVEAATGGQPTSQETRTFDVKSGKTIVIRSKEGAKDYRFMPEPDLPPVVLNEETFDGMDLASYLEEFLPELPDDARNRLQNEHGLSEYMAGVLSGDPPAIQILDEAVAEAKRQVIGNSDADADEADDDSKNTATSQEIAEIVANLLSNELFALVQGNDNTKKSAEQVLEGIDSVKYSLVNGAQLGEVVALILDGTISNSMAKQLLKILSHNDEEIGKKPREVAKKLGLQLITDRDELESICHQIIDSHPDEMERYKMSDKLAMKITKFLLGKAMALTKMNAHPERLREILVEVLEKETSSGIEQEK